MRIYGGRVFRLDRHLARLDAGARALGLELPGGVDALREIVLATARAHGGAEAYMRLIVTRGEGALGVDPTTCPQPRVICLVDRVAIYPEEKRRAGIDLVTASLRRPPPDVLDPRVKSLNYLNNVLAKGEARRRGADDALLLNRAGHVAEAAVANVFVVRDGDAAHAARQRRRARGHQPRAPCSSWRASSASPPPSARSGASICSRPRRCS